MESLLMQYLGAKDLVLELPRPLYSTWGNMWCQRLNWGWLHARQAPCLLSYLSVQKNISSGSQGWLSGQTTCFESRRTWSEFLAFLPHILNEITGAHWESGCDLFTEWNDPYVTTNHHNSDSDRRIEPGVITMLEDYIYRLQKVVHLCQQCPKGGPFSTFSDTSLSTMGGSWWSTGYWWHWEEATRECTRKQSSKCQISPTTNTTVIHWKMLFPSRKILEKLWRAKAHDSNQISLQKKIVLGFGDDVMGWEHDLHVGGPDSISGNTQLSWELLGSDPSAQLCPPTPKIWCWVWPQNKQVP